MSADYDSMVLSDQDLADIQAIAEDRFNLGLNPHSTLKLLRAYKGLRATLDDVSRGSTHELVRYWLDTTVKAEARVKELEELLSMASDGKGTAETALTALQARIDEAVIIVQSMRPTMRTRHALEVLRGQ
jgi:hypothetical protein